MKPICRGVKLSQVGGVSKLGRRRVSALAFCLLCCLTVWAAPFPADYLQTVWGTAAGLPSTAVTAIVQTPDGYLWLGTQEGLARFDGNRFTVFDKSTVGGNQFSVTALCVTRDG